MIKSSKSTEENEVGVPSHANVDAWLTPTTPATFRSMPDSAKAATVSLYAPTNASSVGADTPFKRPSAEQKHDAPPDLSTSVLNMPSLLETSPSCRRFTASFPNNRTFLGQPRQVPFTSALKS